MLNNRNLTIDKGSSTPLYEQLKLILRERIVTGEFGKGDQLPTERELCERYGVSRITAVRALNDLAGEGLIERIQGKGSIVRSHTIAKSLSSIEGFTQTISRQGYATRSEVLEIRDVDGDIRLRARFKLPADSPQRFTRIKRLRFVNDQPVSLAVSVVRKELGDALRGRDLERTSFYALFEEILGRRVSRNDAVLHPIVADAEIADALDVAPGSPHFLTRGITYVEGDLPVEMSEAVFHGERFEFSATMHQFQEDSS